jgi:hypothetical protein
VHGWSAPRPPEIPARALDLGSDHAVIKPALEPFFVAFHELAGIPFVVRKPEKYDKHRVCSPVEENFNCCANRTASILKALL